MKGNPGRLILLLLTILGLLSNCSVKNKNSKSSMSTPSPAPKTIWGAAETALSNAVLGVPGGKCEWEVLGWFEQERYIWAFCQSGPGVDAIGASQPAVVRVSANGLVQSVTLPGEGNDFSVSVRRLFHRPSRRKSSLRILIFMLPFPTWKRAGGIRHFHPRFSNKPEDHCQL